MVLVGLRLLLSSTSVFNGFPVSLFVDLGLRRPPGFSSGWSLSSFAFGLSSRQSCFSTACGCGMRSISASPVVVGGFLGIQTTTTKMKLERKPQLSLFRRSQSFLASSLLFSSITILLTLLTSSFVDRSPLQPPGFSFRRLGSFSAFWLLPRLLSIFWFGSLIILGLWLCLSSLIIWNPNSIPILDDTIPSSTASLLDPPSQTKRSRAEEKTAAPQGSQS